MGKKLSARKAQLKDKYGLTLAEYENLFNNQNGKCAICFTSNFGDKLPSVDHDHETAKVRGLLCTSCNVGLGMFKDSEVLLKQAARYLRNSIYLD